MRKKNGVSVPKPLASALAGDVYSAWVFDQMRPSCQKQYTYHIAGAVDRETMERRALAAVE